MIKNVIKMAPALVLLITGCGPGPGSSNLKTITVPIAQNNKAVEYVKPKKLEIKVKEAPEYDPLVGNEFIYQKQKYTYI